MLTNEAVKKRVSQMDSSMRHKYASYMKSRNPFGWTASSSSLGCQFLSISYRKREIRFSPLNTRLPHTWKRAHSQQIGHHV